MATGAPLPAVRAASEGVSVKGWPVNTLPPAGALDAKSSVKSAATPPLRLTVTGWLTVSWMLAGQSVIRNSKVMAARLVVVGAVRVAT
jgi:hypothetical protein